MKQPLVTRVRFAAVASVACLYTFVGASAEAFWPKCKSVNDGYVRQNLLLDTGSELPQFGPANELVVPLGFKEVNARLADPSVRANAEPAKLRLRLNDVTIYDKPAAGIRVFLNSTGVGEEWGDAIPGYVSTVAFFPRPTGRPSGELVGSSLIDLDEAVARLAASKLLPTDGHKLTIVPIDDEGQPSGRVAIGSPELLPRDSPL